MRRGTVWLFLCGETVTRRSLCLPCLGVLALWLCPWSVTWGQSSPKIMDVRVGFPQGPGRHVFKPGLWTPVIVELGMPERAAGSSAGMPADFSGLIELNTVDGDGQVSTYKIRPVLLGRNDLVQPGARRRFFGYLKAGRSYSQVQVELKDEQSRVLHSFTYPVDCQQYSPNFTSLQAFTVLSLGTTSGLDDTARSTSDESLASEQPRQPLRRDTQAAKQTEVELLPQFWFGYEGVRTIILPTGTDWSGSLPQALVNDPTRRTALEQWVFQGGHLVICVAQNAAMIANRQTFPLEPLLPAQVDPAGTARAAALNGVAEFVNRAVPREVRRQNNNRIAVPTMPLARLTPRGSARVLVSESSVGTPSVVEGSYGFGKVTLVAFDVDRGPFIDWENRYDFWTALLELQALDTRQRDTWGMRSEDVGEVLANSLETFSDVTMVPFLWVAGLILAYIMLIGPVDYFVLKKVVKRLELTWITFPVIVLTVSVLAYLTANYLKGDELRVNKIDVIDVDASRQRISGSTFFSIFSPRLQNFDITLRPAGVGDFVKDTLALSWLARPGFGARGLDRGQTLDLFRRAYEYADDASRLNDVPIQVWALKSFIGRWQSQLEPGARLIRHSLRESKLTITGTVTSLVPQPLTNVRLVSRDCVWDLGTLAPGQTVPVPAQFHELKAQNQFIMAKPPADASGETQVNYGPVLDSLLFHKLAWRRHQEQGQNALYEHLDQSWRLKLREAILVGVLQDEYGPATELNNAIKFGTQLDLAKPPLKGVMRQMTVVRFTLELPTTDR